MNIYIIQTEQTYALLISKCERPSGKILMSIGGEDLIVYSDLSTAFIVTQYWVVTGYGKAFVYRLGSIFERLLAGDKRQFFILYEDKPGEYKVYTLNNKTLFFASKRRAVYFAERTVGQKFKIVSTDE